MTWTISIMGHDDLSGDKKAILENTIVGQAISLVESLKAHEGNKITSAIVSTNTTGQKNLVTP